jgi:hypothetical protein
MSDTFEVEAVLTQASTSEKVSLLAGNQKNRVL